jgi:hypothetical protein
VPNTAITPIARRVHWIESDTRQAFVNATVSGPSRIDITARWARTLRVFLHDRLVNLDRPVEIRVNGVTAFTGKVPRSALTALQNARTRGDERLIDAAVVTVTVPATPDATAGAERAFNAMTPKQAEGTLSFWEMYATRALEERVPSLGFEAAEEALPAGVKAAPEQVALRVRSVAPTSLLAASGLKAGDLLIEVGGEPFFRGRGGAAGLHHWLIRELRGAPAPYSVAVWRDGKCVESSVQLKLGGYTGS